MAKAAGGKVEVELLADQIDVDTAYSESLDKLRLRQPLDKSYGISQDEKVQRQKDYYVSDERRLSGRSASRPLLILW